MRFGAIFAYTLPFMEYVVVLQLQRFVADPKELNFQRNLKEQRSNMSVMVRQKNVLSEIKVK